MGACAECGPETRFEWVRPDLNRSRRKRKGRRTKTVLLMQGWDDRLLSAYLHKSTVPSDIDTATSRNRASLRVRCSYLGTCHPGWSF